jgi:hypothetical protein
MSHTIQTHSGLTTRQLCDHLALTYSTLLRWRRRARNGLPLLARPGPKKLGALPFEALRCEVEQLVHGKKRTAGTGVLRAKYQHAISRRDLAQLIMEQRRNQNAQRLHNLKRITWKEPNLCWAIDATEYERDKTGRKLYLVATQDLASHYSFEPLPILSTTGEEVAAHLRRLFRQHGPPLFLKRDNGSIFNNQYVDELLAKECVIPLNSPAYYPPYNGAIEKGIRELKDKLHECLPPTLQSWQPEAVACFVKAAAHLRNCTRRRSLGGHTAAETYHHQTRSRFGKRERHATFEWIKLRSNATIQQMEKHDRRSIHAAWRTAAETWLRCQGLISLSLNGKVLPHLPLELVS